MARRVPESQIKAYERQRYELQQTRADAARSAAVTQEWARLHDAKIRKGELTLLARPQDVATVAGRTLRTTTRSPNQAAQNASSALKLAAPVNYDALSPEAKRALTDFEYFRLRYFGRRSMPWAVDAMHRLESMMRSPEREYVVINVAPGTGKSTLLHDFAVWETVQRRWLRGLWGSATAQLAGISTKRLRTTLGASYTIKAKQRDMAAGYGIDAEATLVSDFGRFRPVDGGVWRTDMFVVEQFDEENYDEKEPTWGAFGQNSEEIGWRANLIVWDDLVTQKTIGATLEAIDEHRRWFDDVAEERLEPGGLFVLMGQRLAANDTYRYCLDKVTEDIDFEGQDIPDEARTPMYHHIVYPAHDPNVCKGHGKDQTEQVPWRPDGTGGCLIDPYRVSWKKCRDTMRDEQKWETVYQQGDSSAQDVLVQKLWIDGGQDNRTGELFVGCWDEDRAACEIPRNEEGEISKELVSYMLVDPSPSRYWGCLWMAYDPATTRRYVLDVFRDKMQAGEFLDVIGGQPVGLAHEWLMRSRGLGLPIRAMVVEANSAERFLLQYEHVRNWMSKHGVRILSHATHQNKADPKFGVQTIGGIWRQGLVRLPGKSRLTIKPLVAEATTYPQGASDDLIMAFWFGEYNLTNIITSTVGTAFKRQMPTWMRREAFVGAA